MPPANSALPGREVCHITPAPGPASAFPSAQRPCLLLPDSPIPTEQHGGAATAGGRKAGSRRLGRSSGAPALASPAWFYDDSSSPGADGISCALLLGRSHGGEGKELTAGTAIVGTESLWLNDSGGTSGISASWKRRLEFLPREVKWVEKVGGLGKREAQSALCAVPRSVTQARSGSRCCQEKLAWKYCISPRGRGFQTIPSWVFVLFFPPFSFFLLLSPKPSPSSLAGRLSSSTLHIPAPAPTAFPTPAPRRLLPAQPGKGSQS